VDFSTTQTAVADWLSANIVQLVVTTVVILLYVALDRFSTPKLEEKADQSRFRTSAATNAVLVARTLFGIVGLLTLAFVWGIKIASVMVAASTALTLLGVALFAQWSILSNVTAYFILLLHPSFKRGTFVRMIDADNYAEGYVADLTFFSTKLITENRETIIYPNNLILGRPAFINPRDRFSSVGKLPAVVTPGQASGAEGP
jgi:small-conductance mechanosensitive channel